MAELASVVLAEDDDDIREIAVRVLRRAGHTVASAADGAEALRLAHRSRPDIVVSDIDMPLMSGVDLCAAIRADPGLRDVPVVLVSGSLMPGDERPEQAHATAMVVKPFVIADLLACVDKALQCGHEDGRPPFACP
ncbi:response regulator [Actinoplanes sp. NPDC051343]|uniref:response regulator n=1 Tax=Actinoplanes sp. NPDC051343 TaxID=3363906 RepID=UPI0037BBDCEA